MLTSVWNVCITHISLLSRQMRTTNTKYCRAVTLVLIYWKFWTSRLILALSLWFLYEIWQWCRKQWAKRWLSAWMPMKKEEQMNWCWARVSLLSVWPQGSLTIWWPFINLLWIYWSECVCNSESRPMRDSGITQTTSGSHVRSSWLL